MESTWKADESLPESVRSGLERFCSQLAEALGDRLVSIILYGGLAKDEYEPRTSNVNVLVVLSDVSVEILDKVVSPVQEGAGTLRLAAMVLSEACLPLSGSLLVLRTSLPGHEYLLSSMVTEVPIFESSPGMSIITGCSKPALGSMRGA